MPPATPFDLKFTSRDVAAWGGLALLKRMLDGMGFKEALQSWDLPQPGSNRGYRPEQLIEQMIVSIWCGAARFAHADITRLDSTLVRLFDWGHAAGHKAIVRLFQRFDQASASRVHTSSYAWRFDKLQLNPITLDVDSTVLTRWGSQIEGGAKGYNPRNKGRASHPRCWRSWLTGAWWPTSGCARATPHRATTSRVLSNPPWRTWVKPK